MKRQGLYILVCVVFGVFLIHTSAFSQENLQQRVETAIANSFYEDFTVTANENGEVTIEGEVETLYDKFEIFNIVAKIPGVRTISNKIIVDTEILPDNIIEDNIRDEMKYISTILEPDIILVKVTNGIVFLDGFVSYYREKIMMQTIASWQKGVKGIVNKINVLPPRIAVSDENLGRVLDQIMKYEFSLEDNVTYTVDRGAVTLRGTVTSLWAKESIAEAFSNVIGILDVENNLRVEPKM